MRISVIFFAILGIFAAPIAVMGGFEEKLVGPATFVGSYISWAGVIIGFVASILTIIYALGMARSTVGDILRPVGTGMIFIVLGFLGVVIDWGEPAAQKIVHDILFISGYVMILIGVFRIRKL